MQYAFDLLNVGHEPEIWGEPDDRALAYRARANRSLSVGDVVRIEHPARVAHYAVAKYGWTAIDPPTVENAHTHGTTPIDTTTEDTGAETTSGTGGRR